MPEDRYAGHAPAPLIRAAIVASILASAALAAQTVEGHVVNAVTGVGVPGVKVVVFAFPGPPADGHSATTDAEGRYRIEGLEDGTYAAIYSGAGFGPIPEPGSLPPPFSVVSGAGPVRLEVKMEPLGKLAGRVVDANGKPAPGASLWLVGEDRWCMPPRCSPRTAVAKANEKGEYAFADLDPGPWLLSATAPSALDPPDSPDDRRLGWAQTFYPGLTDPQNAGAVMVGRGSELWNLDIKLAAAPVHRLRGRIVDVSGHPVAKASVALGKGFGPNLSQETAADGTFQFAAVVDDEWRLSAAVDRGGVQLKGAQSIEIRDHDLENLELRLDAPFALRGKIVVEVPEGAPAREPPSVILALVSGMRLLSDAGGTAVPLISNQGNLTVRRGIYPGPYEIETLEEAPAPYYLDSIRLGDQSALGWVSILSNSAPLTVTYKIGGGSVRGAIEGCSGGHVLLIPQDQARRRHAFMYFATCGQSGQFEFPAVRPGEYYGLAIAGVPSEDTLEDSALLRRASRVVVKANESTSADIRLTGR
jgi:hypothetical protein